MAVRSHWHALHLQERARAVFMPLEHTPLQSAHTQLSHLFESHGNNRVITLRKANASALRHSSHTAGQAQEF
jgi:hypothetical protein